MRPQLSLVIPVLNEAAEIQRLHALQPLRQQGVEVIVVDGGSADHTAQLAEPLVDQLITADTGRALQMNAGAQVANGEMLFFLHLDTALPDNFLQLVAQCQACSWGFFRLKLSGDHWQFRVIESLISWRSRLTSVATGDQVIFCRKDVFEHCGGYQPVPLMEDVRFSKNLRRLARPCVLNAAVTTSSRRWERNGILRTVLLMWRLRLAHFFGVSPERLVRRY